VFLYETAALVVHAAYIVTVFNIYCHALRNELIGLDDIFMYCVMYNCDPV